jgi:NADPH2:quinone reductase
MKAAQYTLTGDDSPITVVDRPAPVVPAGHVRVKILVSGVNPTDVDQKRGSGAHRELKHPQVPNQDGAGTVDAIADDITDLKPGDRVWVWDSAWQRSEGTAQELVVLPAKQVVALPGHASFDLGASLGIPALTAHRALTSFAEGPARLSPGALKGHTVLVAGGAGAVGHMAIQLARWAGAQVITTVSDTRKAELAHLAGAHHVIDYTTTNLVEAVTEIARPSIIVEVNAKANLHHDIELVALGGGISIYTPGGGSGLDVPARAAMMKNVQLSFVLTYLTSEQQKMHAVDAVAAAVADGAITVGEEHGLPLIRYDIGNVPGALGAVESHFVGKVLIAVP